MSWTHEKKWGGVLVSTLLSGSIRCIVLIVLTKTSAMVVCTWVARCVSVMN